MARSPTGRRTPSARSRGPGSRSSPGTAARCPPMRRARRPRAARSPTGRRRTRSARSSASRPCRSSASPRSCPAPTPAGCRGLGAQQAVLLRAEPDEADLVARLHLADLVRDLEDRRRAGPVVVDARARADAVEMRAYDDDVVRIAVGRLRDHVRRLVGPRPPVDLQTGGEAGEALLLAVGQRRRGVQPARHGRDRDAVHVDPRAAGRVEEEDRPGAELLRAEELRYRRQARDAGRGTAQRFTATLREPAARLPATSVARTESTTLAFPRLVALRSLTSAFLESLTLSLACLPLSRVAFARPRPTVRLPIRSFATTASLQRSSQRADSARRLAFSARWILFAARVSFGAVLSDRAGTGVAADGSDAPGATARAGAASSSVIVTVAPAGDPRLAPPAALESFTWNASSPSCTASLVTWTVKLLLASPGPKVSVPAAAA